MDNKVNVKPLEQHLQRISGLFISIENVEKRVFTEHFDNVSRYMIKCMKDVDQLFKKTFQGLQLAGSYADGIKVTSPNEYDVLVLLNFPKPLPVGVPQHPGYVTINIENAFRTLFGLVSTNSEYKRFVDNEGYLIQDEILNWFRIMIRGIINKHNYVLSISGVEYSLIQKNCGPAITVEVKATKPPSNGRIDIFSIDFVAALRFTSPDDWVADNYPVDGIPGGLPCWNAIPKPNKSHLHKNRNWICSYAEIERECLSSLNRIKPLIKIFKKIRDRANLSNFKSYYIKTIFLHRRHEMPNDYWNRSLAVLFMEMFSVILEHLQTRTLWSLCHRNYNLFDQLDEYQINYIYHNLKMINKKFIRNLNENRPECVYDLILTSDEKRKMEMTVQPIESSWNCTIL